MNNLRNFLRILQLRIVERSAAEGNAVLAISTQAICRFTARRTPRVEAHLETLYQIFGLALNGKEIDEGLANACMERVYSVTQAEENQGRVRHSTQ